MAGSLQPDQFAGRGIPVGGQKGKAISRRATFDGGFRAICLSSGGRMNYKETVDADQ